MTELLREHITTLRSGVACCLSLWLVAAIVYVINAHKDNQDDRNRD